MNNLFQKYNYVPTSINNDQFLSYKQPGYYMTDYRPSSDTYSFLLNNATNKGGIKSSHQLRQYMQDNAGMLSDMFLQNTANKFNNLNVGGGAPNVCSGAPEEEIYNGGAPLVNSDNKPQLFPKDCNNDESCVMDWKNTPLPQQGPHCQKY